MERDKSSTAFDLGIAEILMKKEGEEEKVVMVTAV